MSSYHEAQVSSNALLQGVLSELLTWLRRENHQKEREEFEREAMEALSRRWGYPIPRRRRCR